MQEKKERILYLSLKESPFNVMVTGEKRLEYRAGTEWIKSRLINKKNGEPKKYDFIVFTNGYNTQSPRFKAKYLGFFLNEYVEYTLKYSNGLEVEVKKGYYIIGVGEVVQRFNLKGLKKVNKNKLHLIK